FDWEFHLSGVASDIEDSSDAVYERFPVMIGVTGGVVLLFIAIAFQSVLIPLRSIFTIAMTIVFVYGFAVLTYITGIFSWLGWSGLEKTFGLTWLVPLLDFSIMVGV